MIRSWHGDGQSEAHLFGELGVPQVLCIDPHVTTNGRHVDVARDGRLLMINTDTSSLQQIALVRNWVEELEARVWVP